MNPVVREYTNDERLVQDVERLSARGIAKEDIYILAHDDDRTSRVANQADSNKIGLQELGLGNAVTNLFVKKGDELRTKMEEVGLSPTAAELYEEKLDEGKILLLITDHEKVRDWM